MSSLPNRHFRQGAGVPGLRLNRRHGYLVVDAAATVDRRKVSTSFLVSTAGPLAATAEAIAFRELFTGVLYPFTPRQAWMRLRDHKGTPR